MKVGLVKPPNTGNSVRGVGFYAERLFNALLEKKDLEISWMNYSKNPFAYQKYDIVHFPFFDPFMLTLPPVRVSRTIVTVHDLIPLKFPAHYPLGRKAKVVWPVQKKILAGVDGIITDSKASKKDIEEIVKIPPDKIFITYLAADKAFQKLTDEKLLSKVKKKFNLPDKFALYVGGVNWNKNVPGLIKACALINLPLVLVGKEFEAKGLDLSHKELASFREVTELMVNNKNILPLGFVETADLVGIYNLATVYVQPSFYEGFGLPVLEALASGAPVVSGMGGSLAEIGGKAVVFAEVDDPKDLAEKISKSKKNDKGMDQANKFSWQKCADETYDIYQEILHRV